MPLGRTLTVPVHRARGHSSASATQHAAPSNACRDNPRQLGQTGCTLPQAFLPTRFRYLKPAAFAPIKMVRKCHFNGKTWLRGRFPQPKEISTSCFKPAMLTGWGPCQSAFRSSPGRSGGQRPAVAIPCRWRGSSRRLRLLRIDYVPRPLRAVATAGLVCWTRSTASPLCWYYCLA